MATEATCTMSDMQVKQHVQTYLNRIDAAVVVLIEHDDATTTISTIHSIAEHLLKAFAPGNLGLPLPDSIRPAELDMVEDDDVEEEEINVVDPPAVPTKRSRIDFLRHIFRAMPPIAIDVAAVVCDLVDTANVDHARMAFCLFSTWLPIAPQLTPLVQDLCCLLTSPLECGTDDILQYLVAQAAHGMFEFFGKRGEPSKWWSLGPLHKMLKRQDVDMGDAPKNKWAFECKEATRWHAARAIGYNMGFEPKDFRQYLSNLNVAEDIPVWVLHPWILEDDDARQQHHYINGHMIIWNPEERYPLPTAVDVRRVIPLHSMLTHTGNGIVFFKHRPLSRVAMEDDKTKKRLILTSTTLRNMSLLGAALAVDPYPKPVLICGPPGSGKSSLVRELIQHFSSEELLELHVDEETDSKTLVGSYTTTDIPGEFTWRPGALTRAVRSGKWVLMEDVDTVPTEIQAALVKLLEDRMLHLGGGKYERCNPNFRLFGTCTLPYDARRAEKQTLRMSTYGTGGKKVLHPNLWTKVHVNPLPFVELQQIAQALYPSIPTLIVESALNVFQSLDQSGRESGPMKPAMEAEGMSPTTVVPRLESFRTGRHASVRDFLKLLSRISHTVSFERNIMYATETQRTLCLAETVDIFAACCPDRDQRREFILRIAAPYWGITADFALRYIETRQPALIRGEVYTEVGRAKIRVPRKLIPSMHTDQKFASTSYSLRLMESIAVGIVENEPMLLVGETGCGKTSLIQELARSSDRELIVQNLSLQTDSTDLLGGYRPLETRQIARQVYMQFVDLFCSSFSRKQNADFLEFAASVYKKNQWKKLSQCFQRASKLGLKKVQDSKATSKKDQMALRVWREFAETAERFERQRLACDSGLAFAFTEGALVDAIRSGKWVLLDEMNLASSETLQRLCGLLDDSSGSVTLTERGDSEALKRHPEFRLFAAMNPATDAGKKDLPSSIRSRFTEIYVDELLDPVELRVVAAKYLTGVITARDKPLQHTDTVINLVEVYLKCRNLADKTLVDASGQRPRYTLRTLCRGLSASKNLINQQKIGLVRAIFEGFELAFEGPLDEKSLTTLRKLFKANLGQGIPPNEADHPGRRPGNEGEHVLIKPFWIKAGPLDPEDWSESSSSGRPKFILTKSMASNLRRLVRACAAGPWPVLLEGPTSAGKTTLVEYLAARCGHHVVRINNHEHTDVQEYTGAYAADSNGSLSFRDGILVQALRHGHWVILDELNLAPSEVLEALNRLLDDNRELFLPEINEVVKPHPNFRLFATQNPSGAYGGRKPLSRAFRNRFVEIHMGDIPTAEMVTILELRSQCPPSHAKALVNIMASLRTRRSKSGVFLGKDGLITPRDLLRWAERHAGSKNELAQEGYMILGERLRSDEERSIVREEIEANLKVKIDCDNLYYGDSSLARQVLSQTFTSDPSGFTSSSIAATNSMLRLLSLVLRCIKQREPVLLVGDTGCGKTTVVQLLGSILNRQLHIVNCHATSETSDLIGGLRPVRGRGSIPREMLIIFRKILRSYPNKDKLSATIIPEFALRDSDEAMPENATKAMVEASRELKANLDGIYVTENCNEPKRRKLDNGSPHHDDERGELLMLFDDLEALNRRHVALFEWSDGPLVTAMRRGHLVLLDEMSLAEDAVLERLNSVLEPTRTIVLAEKGDDGLDTHETSHIVKGHDNFLIFATMNPGGDFGKRELSPALRSRFTELWVPAIKDLGDIDLVLGSIFQTDAHNHQSKELRKNILDYVSWFNSSICGDPSSPFVDLVLSLRDVIAWARFVVEASEKMLSLGIWEAYCHGACLMHLDGLGLGTGLSTIDADFARSKASEFLLSQVPSGATSACRATLQQEVHNSVSTQCEFGIHPFKIPLGPKARPASSFNFAAPTTAKNLLRVLRAMQISKPVLLEGSPGVGKTSLISSLAAASGHELVRINLSEQTDISDLMGSDLPVPDDADGDGNGASFKWCDGVLLRAIKNGEWVLLDELNLASQSVLEGLNSCLDHRAEVYIPELGETFQCPPSFRIFAAQNPLAQGGGRKGLPKSFLNRFSKVYVDSLSQSDLNAIVSSKFPSIPSDLACAMVNFNSSVHEQVVDRGEFGDAGKPWEFNLRDVFRWCELVAAADDSHELPNLVSSFARDLYLQRFRSLVDRVALAKCFEQHFGTDAIFNEAKGITMDDDGSCRIGMTLLHSCESHQDQPMAITPINDQPLLRSLLNPMEALARCITMKWPCLLVGPSSSGKTSLLQAMASLANATLVNVCLTPSTDVNELVGGFEQIDTMKDTTSVLTRLELFHQFASKSSLGSDEECLVLSQAASLMEKLESASLNKESTSKAVSFVMKAASLIMTSFSNFARLNQRFREYFNRYADLIFKLVNRVKNVSDAPSGGGHFCWIDGVLVEAMTCGHWIHLENVNLCSSSVLDRLNPIMEDDGELLLNECSSGDESSRHRIVTPHANFRIFLSMNSEIGEVSRAMRNRCVEIALVDPSQRSDGNIEDLLTLPAMDMLDMLSSTGIPSINIGSNMHKQHQTQFFQSREAGVEAPVVHHLSSVAHTFRSLQDRGLGIAPSDALSRQICYEHPDGHDVFPHLSCTNPTVLLHSPTLRWGWSFQPNLSSHRFNGRLVRMCLQGEEVEPMLPPWLTLPRVGSLAGISMPHNPILTINSIFFVMALYQKKNPEGSSAYLDLPFSYHSRLANGLQLMSAIAEQCPDPSVARLSHLAVETVTYQTLRALESVDGRLPALSPLEKSFCLFEGTLDRSSVVCPVTPTIYPLFRAFDDFMLVVLESKQYWNVAADVMPSISLLLMRRDQLWTFLRGGETRQVKERSFLEFDEGGFIVQWVWLKKQYQHVTALLHDLGTCKAKKQSLDILIGTIDRIIFDSSGELHSVTDSVWKNGGHPVIPSSSRSWQIILRLRRAGLSCSLVDDVRFNGAMQGLNQDQITLGHLIDCQHPILFAARDISSDFLGALCMLFFGFTDEAQDLSGGTSMNIADYQSLDEKLSQQKLAFTASWDATKIDFDIETVENSMDVEKLETLRQQITTYDPSVQSVHDTVLNRFAEIQASPFVEYWCAKEEMSIIGLFASSVVRSEVLAACVPLVSRMKNFIEVGLRCLLWPVGDLRPFQTLVWALSASSSDDRQLERVMKSLLPTMISNSSTHVWCNTFNRLDWITNKIELPIQWATDGPERRERQAKNADVLQCSIGPMRLYESVRTDTVLRLVGSEFSCSLLGSTRSRFMTLENFQARQHQAKFLVNQMAVLHLAESGEASPLCIINYLLENTLEALCMSFPDSPLIDLLEVSKSAELLNKSNDLELMETVGQCTHAGVRSLLGPVLVPLLSYIRVINQGNHSKENAAMAWVQLGLLRVHLLTPSSPLDPAKKPAAKVEQHTQQLVHLDEHLRLIRVDSGLLTGDFNPETDQCQQLMKNIDRIADKRKRQEKKRVERIPTAPAFYDLFRETNNFVKTVVSVEAIESLTTAIRMAGESRQYFEMAMNRESSWQNTAGAFTLRLSKHFEAYDDITVPIMVGIGCLQRGMRELLAFYCNKTNSWDAAQVFNNLIHFPIGDLRQECFKSLKQIVLCESKLQSEPESASLTVALASLSRFVLQRQVHSFLNGPSLLRVHTLFVILCGSWLGKLENLESKDETDDEVLERTFREIFPNHAKAFDDVIYSQDREDGTTEESRLAAEEEVSLNVHLDDKHIYLLVSLHKELFQARPSNANDASRIRAFHTAFGAANVLHQPGRTFGKTTESMSPHAMALCLTYNFRTSSTNLRARDAHAATFHCDPNPVESTKAALPLRRLMTRTSQLLTAFPGHSVLLSVGQVAEKVTKLEVTSTSVGKFMTGLEVILRRAQEWEQHASERVKLGSALKEVSVLVAHWRKLELQSWSSLMDTREERFIKHAQRHWMRLYSVIHRSVTGDFDWILAANYPAQSQIDQFSVDMTPWLWKGLKRKLSSSMRQIGDFNVNIEELTKIIDTFILTATLGQFSERLSIIEAFANQLSIQPSVSDERAVRQSIVARMLHSVRSYYAQFQSFLETKKQDLRHPIEKQLRDEVKLAKWDEQSYYALADSSERNHRKLMKFLREYDGVLDQPISAILEKHQCSGIRATDSLDSESSTKIPTFKIMFPICEPEKIFESVLTNDITRTTLVSSYHEVPTTEHIQRLGHYQRKFRQVAAKQEGNSWAKFGSLGASELSSDIFDRIDSLRREKTTKPMKARALVDLFKTLKNNGYKNTKWSVPEQQRQIGYLFHLPSLDCDSFNEGAQTKLASGNNYFQKSVAEINRLRSEVSLLGSQFLSHREIQLMLHLSEHGLLMISQQKAVLSESLWKTNRLAKKLESLSGIKGLLPVCQEELTKLCNSFNERLSCAAENLNQLRLLLTTSLSVVDAGEKRALVQDSIALVDTMGVSLQSFITSKQVEIVTKDELEQISKASMSIGTVATEISILRSTFKAKHVLPVDIFDKSIEQLLLAVAEAQACVVTSAKNDQPELGLEAFLGLASSTVEKALLAIQGVCKVKELKDETVEDLVEEDENHKLWYCHEIACHQLDAFDIAGLGSSFDDVIQGLKKIHSSDHFPEDEREQMVSIAADVAIFLGDVLEFANNRIIDYISFFRETTKLQYVLLRVFRTLVAKGFCSSETSEEDGDGDGGDVSGMNFEDDVEGTGMGEGDGKNDVSDQLESEEQLLGLKNDEKNESEENKQESKKLDEEEAKQGMEMEADFDGELCDVPDDLKEDEKEDENGEEELDREMGDGQDPNEEVVDEKMWGDSDDEDDVNVSEEKFEKDSGVKGEALEDEMRTKEDDEKDGKGKEDEKDGKAEEEKDESKPGKDGDDKPQKDGDDDINEDLEDNYEDQHRGIDVRDEEGEQKEEEQAMELDDINLDGGDDAEDQDGGDPAGDPVMEDEKDDGDDGQEGPGELGDADDDPVEDEEADEDVMDTGAVQNGAKEDNDNEMDNDEDPNENEAPNVDQPHKQETAQESFGIKSSEGADNVKEQPNDEETMDEANGQGEDDPGDGEDDQSPPDPSGGSSGGNGQGGAEEQGEGKEAADSLQAPNPFKNPGDATKFWHKKLKMIQNQDKGGEGDTPDEDVAMEQEEGEAEGEFEFTASDQKSTAQVLGETTEEEAVHVDEDPEDQKDPDEPEQPAESKQQKPKEELSSQKQRSSKPTDNPKPVSDSMSDVEEEEEDQEELTEEEKRALQEETESANEDMDGAREEPDHARPGNQVISDMSQLHVREDEEDADPRSTDITAENAVTAVTHEEAMAALQKWSRIQGETHSLSRRLCEKLRLVMEPLVATKLKGDYRTGKRINMKRVIGYIASGYRKDKIWLRRTKPAKRNYRVLLAVDNSESMLKSGAGDMALQAMATLALGMSQLEIGELGVASFGQEMRLLHPFQTPFTSESGSKMVQNFGFDESRTRTALCVESALEALESQGGLDSMQLIFIISDGRIERDSRANLRRLMREMVEKNILLVMIIVEPGSQKKDSIVKMKEVTFERGKPIVKQFIEDYPFPYYLVLEDMQQLPEVLGDALRQWFEMISQLQSK